MVQLCPRDHAMCESQPPRRRLNSEACAMKGQAIVFAAWRYMNVLIGGGRGSWKVFRYCGQCCGSRGGMEGCSFPSRREKRVPHVSPITSDAARSLPPRDCSMRASYHPSSGGCCVFTSDIRESQVESAFHGFEVAHAAHCNGFGLRRFGLRSDWGLRRAS
jgi:hypothetical protein